MDNNKKLTTEELEKQCEEAKKNFDRLNEQLQKMKKTEEERKQAELALIKETRKQEVEDALSNYLSLLKAYIKDYGYFTATTDSSNWDSFFGKPLWPWSL